MKKQKKQLIILIALLVVMLLALVLVRFLPSGEEEEETVTYDVTTLDSSEVTEMSFTNENGTFSFVKNGEEWKYKEDSSLSIDGDKIDSMIDKVASYSSDNIIENVTDASVYGLENPSITIQLVTAEQTVSLDIGDYNSTAYVYYMCLADNTQTVYTIASSDISSYENTVDDFVVEEETQSATN